MKKRKIFIVTMPLGNNGAERVLSLLANEWVNEGIQVTVIQLAPEEAESYELDQRIELLSIQCNCKQEYLRLLIITKDLIKILNSDSEAPVISFLNGATITLALCRPFIKNRLVFSERNDPRRSPKKKLARWFRYRAFCIADACVFQTTEAQSLFPRKAREKSVVIKNPINPDLPPVWSGERRKVIVTAGRLTKQKNLEMLLQAFALLCKDVDGFKMEVFGQGREEVTLLKLAFDLGIEHLVSFMGFSNDLHNMIKDAYMYVSSSDYEGIPNSVLEAMAMGLPTVSTDCPVGGPKEIVDGSNGILVPVGDAQKMAAAMKRIATNRAYAEQLSINAASIRNKYPVSVIAKKWLQVIFPSS